MAAQVSEGAANIGSGFLGGLASGGSLSQSALGALIIHAVSHLMRVGEMRA